MEQHDFDPEVHEAFVSARLANLRISIARVALFDELIDYHLDGSCTFDEAVSQFLHDANEQGIGYGTGRQAA